MKFARQVGRLGRADVPRPPFPGAARFEELDARLKRWNELVFVSTLIHHLIYWPTMVVFLRWFYQVCRNLGSLQAAGLSIMPGLATISFFVPILNLFRPYQVVQEIWRASDPQFIAGPDSWQHAPRARSAGFWWATLLIGSLLSFFSSCAWHGSPMDQVAASKIGMASNLCMIVAGVFLIFIVRTITARQRERFARLYGAGEAA